MTRRKIALTVFAILALALIAVGEEATAYEIEARPSVPVENRFIVGPAKIELSVPLGGMEEAIVEIENRTGRTESYQFSFEDFEDGESAAVKLLGDTDGDRSLRRYLSVESPSVTLAHGERARIPVRVSMPSAEMPGGKFGALIVSASPNISDNGQSAAPVIGRVAVLFFVTVPGDVTYAGMLESFQTKEDGKIFTGSTIPMRIGFRNSGSAHLNPYGVITIRNMFGGLVVEHPIDPWYVLPDSLRTRDLEIASPGSFGWYTATLEINRGYDDIIDSAEVWFLAVSPGSLILLLVILILLGALVRQKRISRS